MGDPGRSHLSFSFSVLIGDFWSVCSDLVSGLVRDSDSAYRPVLEQPGVCYVLERVLRGNASCWRRWKHPPMRHIFQLGVQGAGGSAE